MPPTVSWGSPPLSGSDFKNNLMHCDTTSSDVQLQQFSQMFEAGSASQDDEEDFAEEGHMHNDTLARSTFF